MADKILLEVDIDDKEVESAVVNIVKAKEAISELQKANAELLKQGQQNSAQFVKNNEDIKTLNKTVGDNSKVIQANNQLQKAAADSIDAFRAANTLLLKERNSLSTSDEASKKRIAEINKLYDENNKKIGDNASATEKQKFNIGNYKSALDNLVPGLGAAASGIEGTTKASLAFIATPIGAVIGAIGVAVAALAAYFKSSEDAQNQFNKIAAVGGVVLERLQDALEAIGEALFSAPSKLSAFSTAIKVAFFPVTIAIENVKALAAVFEKFFPETAASIKKYINDISADAQKLSDLEAAIDTKERELIEQRSKTALEVSQLREKAAQSDGAAKRKYVTEAITLEKALADAETEQAIRSRDLAAEKVRINGDDKAALKELSDAEANVNNARASAFQNTLKMQKELEALRDKDAAAQDKIFQDYLDNLVKVAKAQDEAIKKEEADGEMLRALDASRVSSHVTSDEEIKKSTQERQDFVVQTVVEGAQLEVNALKDKLLAGEISQQEYNQEIFDMNLAAMEAEAALKREFGEADIALEGKIKDSKISIMNEEVSGRVKQAQQISSILGQTAALFGKSTVAYKALASAQALINAYAAAAAAIAPPPLGAGPIIGPIFAALSIITGIANVAKINAVAIPKLADGGVIPINGKSHTAGGEDVTIGGKRVANVQGGEHMVVMKRGAMDIFNQLSRANELAGGVAFSKDRAPRTYMADGGIVARAASPNVQSFDQLGETFASSLKELKIYTRVTAIEKAQKESAQVKLISDLK